MTASRLYEDCQLQHAKLGWLSGTRAAVGSSRVGQVHSVRDQSSSRILQCGAGPQCRLRLPLMAVKHRASQPLKISDLPGVDPHVYLPQPLITGQKKPMCAFEPWFSLHLHKLVLFGALLRVARCLQTLCKVARCPRQQIISKVREGPRKP